MAKDIFKDSIWYTILGFLPLSFSLLFTPIYLLYLNKEQYGILTLFVLYTGLVAQIYSLGLSSAFGYLYWDVYNDKTKLKDLMASIMGNMLFLQSIFLIIGLLVGEYFIELFVKASDVFTYNPYFIMVLILSIFMVYYEMFLYYFRNEGKIKQYALTSVSTLVLFTVGTLVGVVWLDMKAVGAVYGRSIGYILVVSVLLIYFISKYKLSLNFSTSKKLLIFSLPLFANSFIGALAYGVDKILIERLDNVSNVAIYGFALIVASVAEIWFNSINNSLSPTLYRLINESLNEKVKEIKGLAHVIILAVIFMILLIIALTIPVMDLIIPEAYHEAIPFIPILAAAIIWRVFTNLTSYSIYLKKKTNYMLYNQSSSFVLTIILGFVFYQFWGFMGIAVAIYFVRLIEFIIMDFIAKKIKKLPFDFRKFIFLSLILGGWSFFCSYSYTENNFSNFLIFCLPLISILIILLLIARKELRNILYTFKNRKSIS